MKGIVVNMKKLKTEKGFIETDITIGILIIMLFSGIVATLFYNYNNSTKELERKAKAMDYAIQMAEYIKGDCIDGETGEFKEVYKKENLNDSYFQYKPTNSDIYLSVNNIPVTELNGDILNDTESGYYISTEIRDYQDIKGGTTLADVVKKVSITVSYKLQAQTQNVNLVTYVSKN